MLVAAHLILFSLMFILASYFVCWCTLATRYVVQRLISALAIHVPEAFRAPFDPPSPGVHAPLETSFWDWAAVVVLESLTGAVGIYLCIVAIELWDVLRMM
jgi:hypothetical protein